MASDMETLAVHINAVRNGAWRFIDQEGGRVPKPVLDLAGQATAKADAAATLYVRQVANALAGYQGDAYYRMSERQMQEASDFLAAAWAWVDAADEPPEAVLEILRAAGLRERPTTPV
jgi:hypothetical protein